MSSQTLSYSEYPRAALCFRNTSFPLSGFGKIMKIFTKILEIARFWPLHGLYPPDFTEEPKFPFNFPLFYEKTAHPNILMSCELLNGTQARPIAMKRVF